MADAFPSTPAVRFTAFYSLATLLIVRAGDAESLYHLATPGEGCSTWTNLGATVDLVCRYATAAYRDMAGGGRRSRDPPPPGADRSPPVPSAAGGGGGATCRLTSLRWHRLDVGRSLNITDSAKFGVWETIPGWGMSERQRVGLLRVREVEPEDVGTYQCEMACAGRGNGGQVAVYHRAQLVLRQPEKNYVIRGIDMPKDFCTNLFWDGVCNLDCNNERHHFDGFDCVDQMDACPQEDMCNERFGNGFCDDKCASAECGWDGGDCIEAKLQFADDTIVVFLARHQVASLVDTRTLGRILTRLLQTVVRVTPREGSVKYTQHFPTEQSLRGPGGHKYMDDHVLYLKLDNTICKKNCFKKAEKAAHFIALALQKGWDPGISITAVTVLSKLSSDYTCPLENNTLLRIDLATVDRSPDRRRPGATALSAPVEPWILGLAITCSVILLFLVFTLTLVACKSRRGRHYKHRRANSFDLYDSTSRIRSAKIPPGTDV